MSMPKRPKVIDTSKMKSTRHGSREREKAKAESTTPLPPIDGRDFKHLLEFQERRPSQSPWSMTPLKRPKIGASREAWAAYRAERRRRKIIKAERRGRIARRESPHDTAVCDICRLVPQRQIDIDMALVAARTMFSRTHVYRVLDPNVESRRGLKTLSSMRRIAHEGLGISLDEFARLVLGD